MASVVRSSPKNQSWSNTYYDGHSLASNALLLAALIGYALGLLLGAPQLAAEMLNELAESYLCPHWSMSPCVF
jgi:hypothetical protein